VLSYCKDSVRVCVGIEKRNRLCQAREPVEIEVRIWGLKNKKFSKLWA
jgi:hypothetical protein